MFKVIPIAESSNLRSVEHDPDTQTMRVTFKGKRGHPDSVYEYEGVDDDDVQELSRAQSAGEHFHNYFKGQYTHRKVS